jgi:hypothetical protein
MPDESWPSTGTCFGVAELVFGIAVRVRMGLARSCLLREPGSGR